MISQSQGALDGFGANHHLRQSLVALNRMAVAKPEIYLPHSAQLFNENGEMNEKRTE